MPRRDLEPRARDRHGRGRPRRSRSRARSPSRAGSSGSAGRGTSSARRPRGGSSRSSGPTCSSARSSRRRCARARSRRPRSRATRSTCSPSRSSRSAPRRRSRSTTCTGSSAAPYPFADLTREQLENVLDMLAGRYPSDEFAELRPRIVWDRTAGRRSAAARARAGSRSRTRARSPTAASTASSRSTAAAASASSTRRWSTRRARGRRSCSAPRPGGSRRSPATACSSLRRRASPARCRSGRARASGGPTSSGARIGAASREFAALSDEQRDEATLREDVPPRRARGPEPARVPARAGARAGAPDRPDDRRRAVPRRDRRLARLRPDAVRRPRARAVVDGARGAAPRRARRSRCSRSGRTTASRSTSPTPTRRRRSPTCSSSRRSSRTSSSRRSGSTALFGARFRENAARALLIPRRRPGQRTPLWQQRLKAQSLLEVARKYGSFPIVLETYRECLQDVFDLPGAARDPPGPRDARARPRRGRDAVGLADGRIAALRLRRHVHVRGRHARGRAPRAGAVARPRAAARAARPGGAPRPARPGCARGGRGVAASRSRANADELHDLLRRVGDLRDGELDAGLRRDARARAARVPRAASATGPP